MPLDLDKVFPQVGGMITRLKAESSERKKRFEHALETFAAQAAQSDSLAKKIAAARTTWLVAGLVDGLDRRYEAPPLPKEFTVLATDGSHLAVDRHRSTRCYLINIGAVVLRYGPNPEAIIDSYPGLYSGDEELVMTPQGGRGREQLVEGTLLGIKRSVDECRELARLAGELKAGGPSLALLDGSLILWSLEPYPEFVAEALLDKGLLSCLSQLQALNDGARQTAVASYISFPRSTEVVNALRVALCPHDPPDCDVFCPNDGQGVKDCDAVAGIRDRDLFLSLLEPGERSALFTSGSGIVRKRYGEHEVYFFYLRVDDEIARVEIPRWVALDEALLGITHSLVLDQCQRGQGYPVALGEAHEQAVVTGADRDNFWQLVDSMMADERLPNPSSLKSQSKRTRWL